MARRLIPVLLLAAVLVLAPGLAFAQDGSFTFDRVVQILYGLIRVALGAAIILAVLFIVWSAIRLMISGGESSSAIAEAKKRLTWAIVGFAVASGALVIVNTLRSAVSSLKR